MVSIQDSEGQDSKGVPNDKRSPVWVEPKTRWQVRVTPTGMSIILPARDDVKLAAPPARQQSPA
jgi:hypothetical protein